MTSVRSRNQALLLFQAADYVFLLWLFLRFLIADAGGVFEAASCLSYRPWSSLWAQG